MEDEPLCVISVKKASPPPPRRLYSTGAAVTAEPLDRDPDPEISLWRARRFFSDGGLCDRFEKLGDQLVQFGNLVKWLLSIVPGLTEEVIPARFRFSVEHGGFGRHGARRTIERLIDLDDYSGAPRGMYSLRPSSFRAAWGAPRLMRARASVWAEWLETQGWPVPSELRSISSGLAHHEDQPLKKRPIPNKILLQYMENLKANNGPVPAQDKLVPDIRNAFPKFNVTRADVRQVHKKVFGELPAGKRRRSA